MSNPKNCIVCFEDTTGLVEISSKSADADMKYVIKKHIWLIELIDEFSKICQDCWHTISAFHDFYCRIEALHNTVDNLEPEVKLEVVNVKEEVKSSPSGSGYSSESSFLSSSDEEFIPVKKKRVSPRNTNDKISKDDSVEEKTESPQVNFEENLKTEEIEPKKVVKKKKRRKCKFSGDSNKTKKSQEEMQKEDELLRKHCNMKCDLCNEAVNSFQEIKTHFESVHQAKGGYILCCGRKYKKRYLLIDHLQWHITPSLFDCKLCNKKFTSNRNLTFHIQNMHEKPFKCDKCEKAYSKEKQLNYHRAKHDITPESKRVQCNECNKFFASKNIYQAHYQRAHVKSNVFVCDICANVYKSKHTLLLHQKIHGDTPIPKIQCQVCGSWHKNESGLRNHMGRIHREGDRPQVCQLCGKNAPTKGALENHIKYVHLRERKHKCSICEYAFKTGHALKEHMATHTGQVLYHCPYCPKTSNSSANMHSHKKKVHTEQWRDEQRAKFNN